jgi:hypothetical protein
VSHGLSHAATAEGSLAFVPQANVGCYRPAPGASALVSSAAASSTSRRPSSSGTDRRGCGVDERATAVDLIWFRQRIVCGPFSAPRDHVTRGTCAPAGAAGSACRRPAAGVGRGVSGPHRRRVPDSRSSYGPAVDNAPAMPPLDLTQERDQVMARRFLPVGRGRALTFEDNAQLTPDQWMILSR